jgi:hypothetical protein
VPRSSQSWCAYFAANAARQPELPWAGNAGLILREREAIARSVQRFQLGETGTGRRFLEKCRRHAQRTGDLEYVEAVQRFLAEEHRHAAILGRFLDLACLPRLQRHWTDGAFRRLRHLAGLGTVVAVLLVAETIAKVYYAALRDATRSPLLTAICRCILRAMKSGTLNSRPSAWPGRGAHVRGLSCVPSPPCTRGCSGARRSSCGGRTVESFAPPA